MAISYFSRLFPGFGFLGPGKLHVGWAGFVLSWPADTALHKNPNIPPIQQIIISDLLKLTGWHIRFKTSGEEDQVAQGPHLFEDPYN